MLGTRRVKSETLRPLRRHAYREIEARNRVDREIERQRPRSRRRGRGAAPGDGRRAEREPLIYRLRKEKKGAWGMPVALGGDEGRDKLRKAAVRGKCPATRGCPNGETRQERSWHSAMRRWANPGN